MLEKACNSYIRFTSLKHSKTSFFLTSTSSMSYYHYDDYDCVKLCLMGGFSLFKPEGMKAFIYLVFVGENPSIIKLSHSNWTSNLLSWNI